MDIFVDKSFVDESFPLESGEYKTVEFVKGQQHMSGKRALDFVRSRHGTNGENSDFARTKRQQKILIAVKDKIFSFSLRTFV